MIGNRILYLSRKDVEKVNLSMRQIIDIVEFALLEKGKGLVEMPPKPGIHPRPNSFIHAMPAYVPALEAAGLKWVSGFPENRNRNLPYIGGLVVLNDPLTGFPMAVMDCTWITGMRTGAATAVAARYLARPDSSVVGIIACGVQGRSNLRALSCLFQVRLVRVFDIDATASRSFAAEMSVLLDLEIQVVDEPKKAVQGADIVVTSGPILRNPQPVIEADWLQEGSFACPLDFDSYWQGGSLRQADKLATDDTAQWVYYRQNGYFQETPHPYADLGEIVVGKKPGREHDRERTICMNLGLALEDIATAVSVYKLAVESGTGQWLAL